MSELINTVADKAATISENNAVIAENEQKVYDAGYAKGYPVGHAQGEADGFAKGYEQGELDGWADGYSEGWSEGSSYGYSEGYANASRETADNFWGSIQDNGNRTNYTYAFAYWVDANFIPAYPIRPTSSGHMFMGAQITEIPDGGRWDFSQSTAMTYVFSSCSIQRVVPSISTVSASDLSALFGWNSAIKEIGEIVLREDGSQKVTYMFDNCSNLEVVNFRGKFGQNISFAQSTKLDHNSIASIVDALLGTASGKTLTLSRTAVNNAFDGGSVGSEWLNLIATKSNWTITLV